MELKKCPTLVVLLALALWFGDDGRRLCLAQSMAGDPTMAQEQDGNAEMEQAALDSNVGQMPEDQGWGKVRIDPLMNSIGDRDGRGKGDRGTKAQSSKGGGGKGGKAGKGDKKDSKGEEKSFSEQTEQALLQFGVLVRTLTLMQWASLKTAIICVS